MVDLKAGEKANSDFEVKVEVIRMEEKEEKKWAYLGLENWFEEQGSEYEIY